MVYQIDAAERQALDAAEDLGRGYLEYRLKTADFGQVFMYLASENFVDPSLAPFFWYHALVLAGARHHHFPRHYIERIARVEATTDPDWERHRSALRILQIA